MQIAIGGIATESCTFSPYHTRLNDFGIVRDAVLRERYPFLENFSDTTFVPTILARALPGGSVEREAYDQIKAEFLERLRAGGAWDGVYLDMHGAMNVVDMDDAEGDWTAAVREVVGADCLIAASYDLHGNVSQRIMDNLDILTAYRTAPHVDTESTRERAVTLLVDCLRQRIRPYQAFIPIPVILPGERTSTEWEPGQSVYARISDVIGGGVLDASLLVGYVWADEPRAHACAIAVGTDKPSVDSAAHQLAQAYWDARHDFTFGVPTGTVDECIQMALDAPESCVFISDSGDNPTAGGVGDVPYFLGRLIALNVPDAVYASIPDAEAVALCHAAGVGAEVALSLGGKLDRVHGKPLHVTGRVLKLATYPWKQSQQSSTIVQNQQAIVQVGGIQVIITQQRTPFHYIFQFQQLDIEPTAHKIVVVKIGYLVPELKQAAPKALLALSPGAVNQDIPNLIYRRIERPMYPLDEDMQFNL